MKKTLFVTLLLLLLVFVLATTSYARRVTSANVITKLKAINNPLRVGSSRNLKVRYYLRSNSIIKIEITKNNKRIKTIKKSRKQKKGLHLIKWNGKNSKNRYVKSGIYSLDITTRSSIGLKRARKRVRIINPTPTTPSEPAPSEPAPTPVEPAPVITTPQLLFSEYFSKVDGLFASNYTNNGFDSSGRWEATSGEMYIKDQNGYTTSPVFRAITTKSDFSNFILSCNMLKSNLAINPYEGLQLFFRYNDPDNLYVVGLRNDNSIHLKKKHATVYTTLAQVPIDSNKLNYWYNLKVKVVGSHIEIFVDGQKCIDAYDSTFTSGKVGIRTDNVTARFDNFEVYSQ